MNETADCSGMRGKTVLITGADGGIGRHTVQGIALQGAHVIMACIDARKAGPVRDEISWQTRNEHIDVMQLDLASQDDIRRFAAEFTTGHEILDVLINNAGVFSLQRLETEDGLERTIGVNYFGHYLLTHLLLPLLRKAGRARIINVASNAYKQASLDQDDLQTRSGYTGMKAYSLSKLAVILFTQELAERLRATGITANAVHPGHAATGIWNMWEHPAWYQRCALMLMRLFLLPPEQAAAASVYLACSDEVDGVSGTYFSQQKPAAVRSKYATIAARKKLWSISRELTRAEWEF